MTTSPADRHGRTTRLELTDQTVREWDAVVLAVDPDEGIVLEICPTSNLLTKALPDEEAVRDTLRAFVEHGVPFTIATDGPEMMGTHLRDEFDLLLRIGALDREEILEADRRAHEASFLRERSLLAT